MLRAGAALLVLGLASQSGNAAREPQRLLASIANFTAGDFARLDRGEPIVRVLDTERREVAVVGAIRIHAPRERLLARYRDISSLSSSRMVLQVGAIGSPPRAGDFTPLRFESYDLETIRECEPGDCGVRLSTTQLEAFRRDVDWESPAWSAQAAAVWRRLLADYVAAYLARGTLADYRNKAEPLNVADEFAVLFERLRPLSTVAPEFMAHLRQFPASPLPGVETILYWSKDDFGLRPITSITHLAIHPGAAGQPVAVGTRQIYATHYFDAGLAVTLGFDDGTGGFYMVTVNRARTRSLASFARAIVRGIVLRRSRDGIEHVLLSTKAALERKS